MNTQGLEQQIQILKWMKRRGLANKDALKELKELEKAKVLISRPLEGTPYIEDIGKFIGSATEKGG